VLKFTGAHWGTTAVLTSSYLHDAKELSVTEQSAFADILSESAWSRHIHARVVPKVQLLHSGKFMLAANCPMSILGCDESTCPQAGQS